MKKLAFIIALFYGICAQAAEQTWWRWFTALFSASPKTPIIQKIPSEQTKEESTQDLYTDKIGINFEFGNKKYNVVYDKDVGTMNIYEILAPARGQRINKDYNKNGITYANLRTKALKQGYTTQAGKTFYFKYQPFLVIHDEQNKDMKIYEMITLPKKLIQQGEDKKFYSKLSEAARKAIKTNNNAQQLGKKIAAEVDEYNDAGYFKKLLLYFKHKWYKQ